MVFPEVPPKWPLQTGPGVAYRRDACCGRDALAGTFTGRAKVVGYFKQPARGTLAQYSVGPINAQLLGGGVHNGNSAPSTKYLGGMLQRGMQLRGANIAAPAPLA